MIPDYSAFHHDKDERFTLPVQDGYDEGIEVLRVKDVHCLVEDLVSISRQTEENVLVTDEHSRVAEEEEND